jgi:CheY-like chemotaxis protein
LNLQVLFVDDDNERHAVADAAFDSAGFDTWHARTVSDAIRLVRTRRFDFVCLDHDMADDGTNGTDVAKAIVERTDWRPRFVWVHSWNHWGVQRILGILHDGHVRCGAAMFSSNAAVDAALRMQGIMESFRPNKLKK